MIIFRSMTQEAECLPSKLKALSSNFSINPSNTKKKKILRLDLVSHACNTNYSGAEIRRQDLVRPHFNQ
jgi:hypothetical protein